MAIRSRSYLKGKFENGDMPDENDFGDLIDSYLHKTEDPSSSISDATEAEAGKSSLISDVEVSTYTTQNENTLPTQIAKVLGLRGLANLWNRIRLFFNEKIFVTDFLVNTEISPTTTDSVYRNTSGNTLLVTPTGGTSINGSTSTPLQVPPGWAVVLKRDNNNDPLQFIGYAIPPNLLSVFVTNDYAYVGLMDVLADKVTMTAVQATGNYYILASPILVNFPNLLMVKWNSTPPTGDTNIKIGTLPYTGIYRFDGTPLQSGDITLGKTYIATPQIFGANLVYVMHGVGLSSGPGYTAENVANKKTDLSAPNNTDYPTTQAVSNAIGSALMGVVDDRGNHDASTNLFPTTGGRGVGGLPIKGDLWLISVAGTLAGEAVRPGDQIRALVDTPGQTLSNWAINEGNITYVPENQANKGITMTGNFASNIVYLSAKAVYDFTVGTFQAMSSNLTALAGLAASADTLAYFTGGGAMALTSLTSFGRSLIGSLNAAAARILLGIDVTRLISNANATITAADKLIGTASTALTTTRIFTMPSASSCSPGQMFVISDVGGAINGTNYLTISRTGSDTINGVTSETIMTAYGMRVLYADPPNNRFVFDKGVLRAGNNLSDVASISVAKANLQVLETPDNNGIFQNGTSGGTYGPPANILHVSPIYSTGKKISKAILLNVTVLPTNPTKCAWVLYEYNPVTLALTVVSQLGEMTITAIGAQTLTFTPIQLVRGKQYMLGYVFDNTLSVSRINATANPLVKTNYGNTGTTSTPTCGCTVALTYTTTIPPTTFNEGGTNQTVILWDQTT